MTARATSQTSVLRWSAHGWNIDDWPSETSASLRVRLFGGWNAGCRGSTGACTLLGPEGSDTEAGEPGSGNGFSDSCPSTGALLCGWGEYRPYVENYTVDASIFLVENDTARWSCSIEENNVRHGFLLVREHDNHWSSPPQGEPVRVSVWWVRFILMYVVKFERANGGCLGNWSRRRT